MVPLLTVQTPLFGTTSVAALVSAPVTSRIGVPYCAAVSVVLPPVVATVLTLLAA